MMNDEPVRSKTHRLDFGKKAPNPIDESIAPLAPTTLTTGMYAYDDKGEYLEPAETAPPSALAITPDEADKFDDTAPDPVPETEPELVPNAETIEALEAVKAGDVERIDSLSDIIELTDQADAIINDEPMPETVEEPEVNQAEDAEEVESIAALEAEKAKLEDQIESRKEAEKQHVCGEIVKVMAQYTVDIDYLAAYMGVKYKRRGSKAKPKYRDPMTGKTWSGRGKTPVWIRDKDFKKFLI